MKKTLLLIMTALLAFGTSAALAGCGGDNASSAVTRRPHRLPPLRQPSRAPLQRPLRRPSLHRPPGRRRHRQAAPSTIIIQTLTQTITAIRRIIIRIQIRTTITTIITITAAVSRAARTRQSPPTRPSRKAPLQRRTRCLCTTTAKWRLTATWTPCWLLSAKPTA